LPIQRQLSVGLQGADQVFHRIHTRHSLGIGPYDAAGQLALLVLKAPADQDPTGSGAPIQLIAISLVL